MPRKTIRIAALVTKTNEMIAGHVERNGHGPLAQEQRQGIINLTSALLLDAGAYNGFSYVQGWKPGQTDETYIAFNGGQS